MGVKDYNYNTTLNTTFDFYAIDASDRLWSLFSDSGIDIYRSVVITKLTSDLSSNEGKIMRYVQYLSKVNFTYFFKSN